MFKPWLKLYSATVHFNKHTNKHPRTGQTCLNTFNPTIRIHIKNRDKDPGFLNQVPTFDVLKTTPLSLGGAGVYPESPIPLNSGI